MGSLRLKLLVSLAAFLSGLVPYRAGFTSDSPPSIGVIYSSDSFVQQRVVSVLEKTLKKNLPGSSDTYRISLYDLENPPNTASKYSLAITIGLSAALHYTREMPASTLSLYGLISKKNLETIFREPPGDSTNAYGIYLDQPPERLLKLAKSAIPGVDTVGVVMGKTFPISDSELQSTAASLGLSLQSRQINDQSDLMDALNEVIEKGDVLIALPDPMVFNRYTVQKILLSTYRLRVPVIAFSSALSKAGATMAVYSTPEQIGRNVGEKAVQILLHKNTDNSNITGPRYFSVTVNRQVTRSLGLDIPDEDSLHNSLSERIVD